MRNPIVVRLNPSQLADRQIAYQIAGQVVLMDQPLAPLFAFQGGVQALCQEGASLPPPGGERLIYDGVAPIVQALRRVRCWEGLYEFRIEIEEVGRYRLGKRSQMIVQTESHVQSEALLTEALLGPPLMLALALRNRYCLHASGVVHRGKAILFLGESGAGKSTLARLFRAYGAGVFGRLADDIVPLSVDIAPKAFSRFPQLKLKTNQPGLCFPPSLPIQAICVLAPPQESIAVLPLTARQRTLALTRHTVASRLFPPALMAKQLAVLSSISVPSFSLCYPRRVAAIGPLAAKLLAILSTY